MNFRVLGGYLIALGIVAFLAVGVMYVQRHKAMSDLAEMKVKLHAKMKNPTWRDMPAGANDLADSIPRLTHWIERVSVGGTVTLALGIGLLLAARPEEKGGTPEGAASDEPKSDSDS